MFPSGIDDFTFFEPVGVFPVLCFWLNETTWFHRKFMLHYFCTPVRAWPDGQGQHWHHAMSYVVHPMASTWMRTNHHGLSLRPWAGLDPAPPSIDAPNQEL